MYKSASSGASNWDSGERQGPLQGQKFLSQPLSHLEVLQLLLVEGVLANLAEQAVRDTDSSFRTDGWEWGKVELRGEGPYLAGCAPAADWGWGTLESLALHRHTTRSWKAQSLKERFAGMEKVCFFCCCFLCF